MLKFLSALLVLTSLPAFAQAPPVLDNKAIVEMLDRGVARDVVLAAISAAPAVRFTFLTADYAEFSRVKIGPEILAAMYARQQAAAAGPAAPGAASQPSRAAATPSVADDNGYLQRGSNEINLSGRIEVPHGFTQGTTADVTLVYLRYLTSWFSVGPAFSGAFLSGSAHVLGSGGVVQFSPRMSDRVYWLAGTRPGFINTRASGFGNDTRFGIQAYTGPRVFLARNVALDVTYRLQYIYANGLGFKDASSSGLTVGFAVVFK